LLLAHYLAQVTLLYCALSADIVGPGARSTRLRLALYLIYFSLVELLFLNSLQFTTTAFLCAQAGIFLALVAARRRTEQPATAVALPLAAAVLLLVAAALIRLESLLMALVIAAPLGLWLMRSASRQALITTAGAVALAALLIGASTSLDRMVYEQDSQWSEFFRYNRLRVKFNDYGWTSYSPRTAHVFEAVGWSQNDHEMIAHWLFDDPRLYTEAQLRGVLESHPWKMERLTLGYGWQSIRGLLRDRSIWAVALAIPFFLALANPGTRVRRTVFGCAIAAVACLVMLTWHNKPVPGRVSFPLLSFPLTVAWLLPSIAPIAGSRPRTQSVNRDDFRDDWLSLRPLPARARLVIGALIVGLVVGIYHQCRHSVLVARDRREFQAFLAELPCTGRELYVCWEAAMPFELISPLDNLRSWSRVPLINLVWTQRTAWQEATKRRFGISSLAQAICQRDDVILVATPAHRALLATFAKEHFQSDVEFAPSTNPAKKYVAGRFQPGARFEGSASTTRDTVDR
jgi:hypothetical protein